MFGQLKNKTLLNIWNKSRILTDPFTGSLIYSKERVFASRAKGSGYSENEVRNFYPRMDTTFSSERLEAAANEVYSTESALGV